MKKLRLTWRKSGRQWIGEPCEEYSPSARISILGNKKDGHWYLIGDVFGVNYFGKSFTELRLAQRICEDLANEYLTTLARALKK